MLTQEEVRGQVNNIIANGGEAVPAPAVTPESLPEVKPEVSITSTPAPVIPEIVPVVPVIDTVKMNEQVQNLNKALTAERESKRALEEKLRSEFKKEMDDKLSVFEKMKEALNPTPITPVAPITPEYLTPEKLEELLSQRELARISQDEQTKAEKEMKDEVATLEAEWNGVDGKPKYDDTEVLQWQKENGSLHLNPTDAFMKMQKNAIIDWEVKQRMAGLKPTPNVERPTSQPGERSPQEVLPKNDVELRAAIREAIGATGGDSPF